MSTLPRCTTKNTIVEADLSERAANGELIRLVVTYIQDMRAAFVTAYFTDEPVRPMYLATRRDRYAPKISLDLEKMLIRLLEGFPLTRVEVSVERSKPSVVHHLPTGNEMQAARA